MASISSEPVTVISHRRRPNAWRQYYRQSNTSQEFLKASGEKMVLSQVRTLA